MGTVASERFATDGGDDVWRVGNHVVVLRREEVAVQTFSTEGLVAKALDKLRESDGDPSVLGLGRSVVRYEDLREVAHVTGFSILNLRWGSRLSPKMVRIQVADDALLGDLFGTIGDRLADDFEASDDRTHVDDLPADPNMAVGLIVAVFGMVALIYGAFERGRLDGRGGGIFKLMGQLGQRFGPTIAIVLGLTAAVAGLLLFTAWWRGRPWKRVLRPRERDG